jgi:hypothetical protein
VQNSIAVRTAVAKLGEREVTRILISFELGSAADINDMDTLYKVVVAVEEAANTKS